MATLVVPEQYAGKTLRQIAKEKGGYTPRLDIIAGQAGFQENSPLTAGQQINLADPSSGEYQWASGIFSSPSAYNQQQSSNFAAEQKAQEEEFLSALNTKIGSQETLTNASERIGGELNLPALRKSAFDLTQTLKNIPQTQETLSKQVGISAPNLQKRIASEQGKLAPIAQEAVAQQQFSEQELGNRLGLLVAEQDRELRPFFEAQLPLLQDRLAREQSNYQQDKENELTLLLTKISQDFQASQSELDRANQLAIAESNYKNSLDQIKFSTDEAIRQATALKELKGGSGADQWEFV